MENAIPKLNLDIGQAQFKPRTYTLTVFITEYDDFGGGEEVEKVFLDVTHVTQNDHFFMIYSANGEEFGIRSNLVQKYQKQVVAQ